ncbi:transposase family protein [Limobrevibacterium gyesilva]|uniref:transposase family protein n=1 Tax=Limobrevibacterium gyesilva TaxID=2991712 RepID=UPI0038D017F8
MPNELIADRVCPEADRITITAVPRAESAVCPLCQQSSRRVHSRYRRKLADLPWQGRQVIIALSVRRFRCGTNSCPRKVFGEQLPWVAVPHARRSNRLADVQRHISLALGGSPGCGISHGAVA